MQILSSGNTRASLGRSGKCQKSISKWAAAKGAKEEDGLLFSVGICIFFFFCIFLLKPKTCVTFFSLKFYQWPVEIFVTINVSYLSMHLQIQGQRGGGQGQHLPQDSAAPPSSLGQVLDKH